MVVAGRPLKLCRVKAGETKSSTLILLCLLAVFRPFLLAKKVEVICSEVYHLKKNRQKKTNPITGTRSDRCPYCGSPVVLRSAAGIYKENNADTMLYVCSKYPACDAYVRVLPGTKTPVGSLADSGLRALRREAHQSFDRLYQSGLMTRNDAYAWLAAMLQAPLSQAHIGYLREHYCRQVIEESCRLLQNRRKTQGSFSGTQVQQAEGSERYAVN